MRSLFAKSILLVHALVAPGVVSVPITLTVAEVLRAPICGAMFTLPYSKRLFCRIELAVRVAPVETFVLPVPAMNPADLGTVRNVEAER